MKHLAMAALMVGVMAAAIAGAVRGEGAPPRDPKACAPDSGTHLDTPDHANPQRPPATTGSGESLSDKLARSDGVLCPPNVDSGIRTPAPETGTMPVIPPPGSPGGEPDVRPK